MDFNLITNNEQCYTMIKDMVPLTMVYYSHIPTAVISLIIGLFIFIKNRHSIAGKTLFSLALIFSLWVLFSLITWISANTVLVMFVWSLFGILTELLFVFCFYFFYSYIHQGDMPFIHKIILGILMLPTVILTATSYNLSGYTGFDCLAIENSYFANYYYIFGLIVFFWILFIAVGNYGKVEKKFKKQVLLLTIGIEFFLLSFFLTGYISSFIDDFKIEMYGLFSMTIFMAFLAYMIIKYKAFNIKLLGAQALVVGIIILIASQFAFIQNPTNRILTGITLAIVTIFGWWLIRSVKTEVKQREDLEVANKKIEADKKVVEKANKKLIELDQQKNEFINIASHQLRTPITVIRGVVSMMLEGCKIC